MHDPALNLSSVLVHSLVRRDKHLQEGSDIIFRICISWHLPPRIRKIVSHILTFICPWQPLQHLQVRKRFYSHVFVGHPHASPSCVCIYLTSTDSLTFAFFLPTPGLILCPVFLASLEDSTLVLHMSSILCPFLTFKEDPILALQTSLRLCSIFFASTEDYILAFQTSLVFAVFS